MRHTGNAERDGKAIARRERAREAVDALFKKHPGTTPQTMLAWAGQYRAIASELTKRAVEKEES